MDKTKGRGTNASFRKRSKVLLIAVTIAMLVAIGVSFAAWDSMSTVKATSGNSSTYANAKVGDIIEFGQYYQTAKRINNDENAEYEKTPIEWIVVDKDERIGQIILMSRYILATGSYFGNWYDDGSGFGFHYGNNAELSDIPYNQAYVDSTVRAYLNNLERLDMGGDGFTETDGYIPSRNVSTINSGLLSSAGFSNQRFWTGLNDSSPAYTAGQAGLIRRKDYNEIYFRRPITSLPYVNRPAAKGFYDEAFNNEQKSFIAPKNIAGYTGHRWPDKYQSIGDKSYVEGAIDKVWLPSVTELNIASGYDWNGDPDDSCTNPSDAIGSNVFEYFKNYNSYKNPYERDRNNNSVSDAVRGERTTLAMNKASNYSIPVYKRGTLEENTAIHDTNNSTESYWTRSPMSYYHNHVRIIEGGTGEFADWNTAGSHIGVRPCVILKY